LSLQESEGRVRAHRNWLVLGFSLALTIATLYFVFRGIDRQVFARLLATQDRSLLATAALFILLQINLGAERWRAILSALTPDHPPSVLSVQAVFYASVFFNCLPLGTVGGDVARVWLARKFPLSVKQLVLSVLVDRVLTVGALIVLALVTLPNIAHPLAMTAWIGCAAALVVGAAAFLLLQPLAHILGRWRDLRLIHLLLRTTEELRYLAQRGGLRGLVWALLSATCGGLAAYCLARSLDIGVGPVAMIAITSIVTFLVALPISLGGWGVREISIVGLLGLLGVDREAALLLSVELGLVGTLMMLPGGLIWLTMREHRNFAPPLQ
jgi:glycosyltransferase 2 family protein